MTRDEITKLARAAGLWLTSDERIAAVERFAALVAAAEREACAQECKFDRSAADIEISIRARGGEHEYPVLRLPPLRATAPRYPLPRVPALRPPARSDLG